MRFVVKIVKWILIGVFIGLLPVLLKAGFIAVDDHQVTKELVLGNGELFLVAAGLAATGIGDLVFEYRSPKSEAPPVGLQLMRTIAGFMAAVVAVAGAAFYGIHWKDAHVTATYMNASVSAVIMAAFCGLCCVILAEVD